ncbi:MAG: DNA replication/repair protein RecF [Firmicutes bacterium]|nr:DNA replication/repair protein RecF [Bacillota bacterium]
MVIQSVELENFRNYKAACAEFVPGVNAVVGANAQGKTNLVEAVYFACTGRSPKISKDKELIHFDRDNAYVSVTGARLCGRERIEIYLTRADNKRVSINATPIKRLGELLGVLDAVFFSPEELKIIKEGPSERRRYMDVAVSQLSRRYFYALNRYHKALLQRNRLLKTGKSLKETLPVWDAQLAEPGAVVAAARCAFAHTLAPLACEAHLFLTDGKEALALAYEGINGENEKENEAAILDGLARGFAKDCENGYTGLGPHKDDIQIKVDGRDIRVYGSQGQQRTAALSLKLAELEVFKSEAGEYPVLILDDVLSELDASRRQKLLERARGIQTLITDTAVNFPADKTFVIEAGKIIGN